MSERSSKLIRENSNCPQYLSLHFVYNPQQAPSDYSRQSHHDAGDDSYGYESRQQQPRERNHSESYYTREQHDSSSNSQPHYRQSDTQDRYADQGASGGRISSSRYSGSHEPREAVASSSSSYHRESGVGVSSHGRSSEDTSAYAPRRSADPNSRGFESSYKSATEHRSRSPAHRSTSQEVGGSRHKGFIDQYAAPADASTSRTSTSQERYHSSQARTYKDSLTSSSSHYQGGGDYGDSRGGRGRGRGRGGERGRGARGAPRGGGAYAGNDSYAENPFRAPKRVYPEEGDGFIAKRGRGRGSFELGSFERGRGSRGTFERGRGRASFDRGSFERGRGRGRGASFERGRGRGGLERGGRGFERGRVSALQRLGPKLRVSDRSGPNGER